MENGTYDKATLAAVHAFQSKFAPDILTPWGISRSTGFVYLTTRKKINEIVCQNTKTFPLTADEIKKIEASKASVKTVATQAPAQHTTPQQAVMPASAPTPTPPQEQDVGTKTTGSQGTPADAIKADTRNFWERVGDFFGGFGRR